MRRGHARHWIAWVLMWLAMMVSATALACVSGEAPGERLLLCGAYILILTALAHSILGERFVLRRLFRRPDLPVLFGDGRFVAQTLRFVWHLLSIAWVGLAALLVAVVKDASTSDVIRLISITTACSALIAALLSRGRHLSWTAFAVVSIATWMAG